MDYKRLKATVKRFVIVFAVGFLTQVSILMAAITPEAFLDDPTGAFWALLTGSLTAGITALIKYLSWIPDEEYLKKISS